MGAAHWIVGKTLKQNEEFTIPLNMSGDCFSVKDAYALKSLVDCDGILISRGALHNPAIFDDIKSTWGEYTEVSDEYDEHMLPLKTDALE